MDLEELSLRIRAMLRRIQGPESYLIDDYEIDLGRRKIFRESQEIEIGRKVFDLLALLLKAKGKVVTIETITTTLWTTAEA